MTVEPADNVVGLPTSGYQLIHAAGNLLLACLVALWLCALVLQTGLMGRSETLTGPFAAEDVPNSQAKVFPLKKIFVVPGFVRAISDAENRSSLRLWINGQPAGPAHVFHDALRAGAAGYSHWGNSVLFTLPPGVPNSAQTVIRAEYPVQTPRGRASLVFVLAGVLTYLLHAARLRRFRAWLQSDSAAARRVAALPYSILFGIGWTLLGASAVYIAILLWGVATGDALTLAIPFRSQTARTIVEWLDPAVPLALLMISVFGIVMGWVAARSPQARNLRQTELSAVRWMRRYGLPVLAMYYLGSVGATWAGSVRHGSSLALVGLIPFFDASGYFADVTAFLRDGSWSEFTSRRALPGAFRTSIMLLGDLRYTVTIALQTVAIAAMAYLGAMAVVRWRGLWAGITYLALSYIIVRSHLSTTMTEPVSLIVALGSIPFFVEALRRKSRLNALVAILLMSAAIWMRPGAMFLIPALPLWFALYFGTSLSERAKQFGIACSVVLAMFAFDAALGRMFGSGSPGNFGHIICGLSIGEGWSGCLTRYPEETAQHIQTPLELQKWLYVKALENLRHDPGPLLNIMLHDPIRFLRETPHVMVTGYSYIGLPVWFPYVFWLIAIAVFYAATLRRRQIGREALFWGLVALSVIGSATIFYFTDGIRAFAVIYPLIALFISLASFSPSSVAIVHQAKTLRQFRVGRWSIAAGAVLLVAIPLAGRQLYRIEPLQAPVHPGVKENVAVVRGMAKSSGLLVIPDSQPLPHGVPSIHFSDFAAYVHSTSVEENQGIVSPSSPKLPFGFLIAPRLDNPPPTTGTENRTNGAITLITPPEFVLRPDVSVWTVTYVDWNPSGKLFSQNWFYVTSAAPYEAQRAAAK